MTETHLYQLILITSIINIVNNITNEREHLCPLFALQTLALCRGLHKPILSSKWTPRENSHANIWAIIFHLLLPQRTSIVAELRGLFYSDLEQADD